MISGRLYKVEAIVLARKNVGEADRILTIFTKQYGKLRVLAKGIRRVTSKRAPYAEVFSRVNMILYRGKTNLDLVNEISSVEDYQTLRQDLEYVSAAYYLCELVDRLLPEKQEHRDVYYMLGDYLTKFNGKSLNTEAVSNQFALELLRLIGFLQKDKILKLEETEHYVESLIERKLRTPKIIRRIA